MSACPQISTYRHYSGPQPWAWIARYVQDGKFLPMIFGGDTEEKAIKIAQDWWEQESRRIHRNEEKGRASEAQLANLAKARAARKRSVA